MLVLYIVNNITRNLSFSVARIAIRISITRVILILDVTNDWVGG